MPRPARHGADGRAGRSGLHRRDDVESQEIKATIDHKGVVWPSRSVLYAVMALQSEINPRMIEIIREIDGRGDDHDAFLAQGP